MGIKRNSKLLSLDDLYNYYANNNQTINFSSAESGYDIVVQMDGKAKFSNAETEDKHKDGMKKFSALAYHDNVNLNKSKIDEEDFIENTKSVPFRPILCNITIDEETGEKDFGSHDYHIEIDKNTGEEIVVYDEKPVGSLATYSIVYDEKQGVNRALVTGYLWEGYCQDAIDILERREETDCSIELSIRELAFDNDDKVLLLKDYYVGGLTLLGAKVLPGMKGSKATLGDFSAEKNSVCNFTEEENSKLIETLEKLNQTLSNFNINTKDEQLAQKGGNDLEMLNQLLEKYNVAIEDVTFEIEGLSDEELESKFEEVFGEKVEEEVEGETVPEQEEEFSKTCPECGVTVDDDSAACPECGKDLTEVPESEDDKDDFEADVEPEVEVEESVVDEEKTEEPTVEIPVEPEAFSKTFELSHDDVRCALYQLLMPYEEANNDWYWIVEVFDDYFIYQGCTGKYFGQKYAKEDETVAFDGEPYAVYSEFLTESERVALKELRANYSIIEEELNKYKEAEIKAQKEEILNDIAYAEFAEEDCMKEVIAKASEYSVQELRNAMDLALAKAYKSKKTFAVEVEEKKAAIKVGFTYEEVDDGDPYGDYFKSLKH